MTQPPDEAVRPRLLLVEDEATIGLYEARFLKAAGFSVRYETNAQSAIKALQSNGGFDIVLMDVVLGGDIDGIAAAKTVAESFRLPVVFLTSLSRTDVDKLAGGVPYSAYIEKGTAPEKIVEQIRRLL